MKIHVTETFEVSAQEIGEAFGKMDAVEQAELISQLEEGLLKSCEGDVAMARVKYEHIMGALAEEFNVTGIEIVPDNLNP